MRIESIFTCINDVYDPDTAYWRVRETDIDRYTGKETYIDHYYTGTVLVETLMEAHRKVSGILPQYLFDYSQVFDPTDLADALDCALRILKETDFHEVFVIRRDGGNIG